MTAMLPYEDFLVNKVPVSPQFGFEVDPGNLNPKLFDWQRETVAWALRQGRALLLEDCGLGKTVQELVWSDEVCKETGGDVLINAPLAVASQFVSEGEKFDVPVTLCRSMADVKPGVNVTNYEMLDHFETKAFAGVVLDESSILKAFSGVTRNKLQDAYCETPYRLNGSATPSPNDLMELGNQAEFLGIMPGDEILARWFINDTMNFGSYRLRGHAEESYWQWVASWAMCLSSPADIGYDGSAYVLPELSIQEHVIDSDMTDGAGDGQLFRTVDLSATGMHKELRRSAQARSKTAAEIANSTREPVVVWCNANYESDLLRKLIPDAVEVRGSDKPPDKERKLAAFSDGTARVIVTKQSIAGFGLNWQHCNISVDTAVSYSFEMFYQGLRRIYRFGQKRPVTAHVVLAASERPILQAALGKASAHQKMQHSMAKAVSRFHFRHADRRRELVTSNGNQIVQIPEWLKAA